MNKKSVRRKYNLTDAQLVAISQEKAAFMLRDLTSFAAYGITANDVEALRADAAAFADLESDGEIVAEISEANAVKNKKRKALFVAIKGVMVRVGNVFASGTAEYAAFGTARLSRQTDAQFIATAKVVAKQARAHSGALAVTGLTTAMVDDIDVLAQELEVLLIDLKLKKSDRELLREVRVTAGNALYAKLISYAKTGRNIWEAVYAAKCNDYVVCKRK